MSRILKSELYVENYAKLRAARIAGDDALVSKLEEWCEVFEQVAKVDKDISIAALRRKSVEYYVEHFGASPSEYEDFFKNPEEVILDAFQDKGGTAPERHIQERPNDEGFNFNHALDNFEYFCLLLPIIYRPGMGSHAREGGKGSLILNKAQGAVTDLLITLFFNKAVPVRAMLLKSRQMGITTVLLAFWVWLLVQIEGFKVMFIIDKDEHMYAKREQVIEWIESLHEIDSRFPSIKSRKGKSITLSNSSMFLFESAMSPNPGTSEMVHALHMSERPKWNSNKERQIMASMVPAIPEKPRTIVIDESTFEKGGQFKQDWEHATAEGVGTDVDVPIYPIFIPWMMSEEYRREPPTNFRYLNEDKDVCELDVNGNIILTEEEYQKKYGLDLDQLYWRRYKIKVGFRGDQELFNQEFPTTPEHAWASMGVQYFNGRILSAVEQYLEDPIFIGSICAPEVESHGITRLPHYTAFGEINLIADGKNHLHIFRMPDPDEKYFIGGDVAQGKLTHSKRGLESDSCVVYVLDSMGRDCAILRDNSIRPEELAYYLVCIGILYNMAKVNCERNKDGETTFTFFWPTGYGNVFYRPNSKNLMSDNIWSYIGPGQRNQTLNKTRAALLEDPSRLRSMWTFREMNHLERKPDGKLAPSSGEHDDCLMARSHAEVCRNGYALQRADYETAQGTADDIPWNQAESVLKANGFDLWSEQNGI